MEEDPVPSYSYDQWDEDLVDLSFQSVPDLHHLLTARGSHLDYQLYSQAAILHNLLRKELNSVTVKPSKSDYSSSTFSADYSSTSNSRLYLETISSDKSSTVSKDPSDILFGSTSTFSSYTSDENYPGSWNILANEKFHVYSIFCILLILILLFFIILFLIIFRCKNSFKKRAKDPNIPLNSFYLKSSISLEESYSIAMNITNSMPACPPAQPSSSPVPCSPPQYSPLSSFSTFHPPGEDRTSPEGSSSGEAEQGREESEQLHEEANDREEDKEPEDEEDTACNVINVEDDIESLYAKINYQSKHHARKCVKISESNEFLIQSGHSSSISECLI